MWLSEPIHHLVPLGHSKPTLVKTMLMKGDKKQHWSVTIEGYSVLEQPPLAADKVG